MDNSTTLEGANLQIPRSSKSAHTRASPREPALAASEPSSCWVSLHPHPYHQSHIWAPLQTLPAADWAPLPQKRPYYEPSNLGPATIGIWHQIFISPLDTISVTSDRHGSPISPVHLSCSCQPTTMSSQSWQKTDSDLLQVYGPKSKLGEGGMFGSSGCKPGAGLCAHRGLLESRDKMEYCIHTFTRN